MTDKAAVWSERVAEWRASGLSAAAFCREQGLAYGTFQYWLRRLGTPSAAVLPIRVCPKAVNASAVALALELPGGARLQVTGLGVTELASLLKVLSC